MSSNIIVTKDYAYACYTPRGYIMTQTVFPTWVATRNAMIVLVREANTAGWPLTMDAIRRCWRMLYRKGYRIRRIKV